MQKILIHFVINSTIVAIVLCSSSIKELSYKCHSEIGTQSHKYLSSKRPYFYNRTSESNHVFTPEGCTPTKFWYFGRHGTRNPGEHDVILMQSTIPALFNKIVEAIDAGRSEFCEETQKYFKTWIPKDDLTRDKESFLVEQGANELFQIGKRYKKRFPQLFPTKFDNDTYFFKHTAKQRTEASAKAFTKGIFSVDESTHVYIPPAQHPDPVIKFYEVCPKWIEEVEENERSNAEYDKFVASVHMNNTIAKVSKRVGLLKNLTLEELNIIFTTCAFETAWKNATILSQWCVLFDLDDFKVLAYQEDLKYYWKDGYGKEINYKQACPPFKDALDYFKIHVENPLTDLKKVQGYFSHSGANLKMLARLGLFHSLEMTAANFEQIKDSYVWRSGIIDTMATNMAFTLFQCVNDEYQIGFYFQEIPQPLAACGGKAFCSFKEFVNSISAFADSCNLKEICKLT